jgi:hypothetical protein
MQIKFSSTKKWIDDNHISYPEPSIKNMPDWYKKAKNFIKDANNNEIISWKACPSMMDSYMTGYVLKTPCDINFFINDFGIIDVEVEDKKYKDFCQKREPINSHGFFSPQGYYKNHFAWHGYWGIETPEGYSCLFLNPINHFNLPFLNSSGIIDTDKVSVPGSIPFFILEGWTGTIKAGTPYMQVIPFKKENWESLFLKEEYLNEFKKRINLQKVFRKTKRGGEYKKNFWNKKDYM